MGTLFIILITFGINFIICYGVWKLLIKVPVFKMLEFRKFIFYYIIGGIAISLLAVLALFDPVVGGIILTLSIGRFLFYMIEKFATY